MEAFKGVRTSQQVRFILQATLPPATGGRCLLYFSSSQPARHLHEARYRQGGNVSIPHCAGVLRRLDSPLEPEMVVAIVDEVLRSPRSVRGGTSSRSTAAGDLTDLISLAHGTLPGATW